MGNSASTDGRLSMRCRGVPGPPPYEPRVELTDRDIAVASAEQVLSRKGSESREQFEVVWSALRNAGVLVYHGPKRISVPRAYALIVGVVQGYNPGIGQSTAVFDPVRQRLTWHDGIPIHTRTWSVTARWWQSVASNRRDPFLAELVAKQSNSPVEGLSPEWADELCRVISQHWHLHSRYSVRGSADAGFWVEFD
jgi:hypothetical protein